MATELSRLSTRRAQADLVRTGDASPLELVDAAIARVEKLNGELNAVIHPLFDRARARRQRRTSRRTVPRCADRRQGPRRHARGRAVPRAATAAAGRGLRRDRRRATCSQKLERAGFVIVGKTNTPEFGLMPTAEPRVARTDAQPVGHDAQLGRFERRFRRRGRERHGAGRARGRRRRLDPHPREHVRAVRPEAVARSRLARPRRERRLGRTRRAPHGRRAAVRDSAAILDVLQGYMTGDYYTAPPPARSVRGRGRRRSRPAAHRHPHGGPGRDRADATPHASPRPKTRRDCSSRSATRSSPPSPAALDEAALARVVLDDHVRVARAALIADTEAQLGPADDGRRRRAAHVDVQGARGRASAARPTSRHLHAAQRWTAADGVVVVRDGSTCC